MTRLLRTRLGGRLIALIALESALILAAIALAAWLRVGADWWLVLAVEGGFEKALYIALVCQVCLYYADLYNTRVMNDRRELFVRVVQALGATSFLLAATYFWFPTLIIGRGVFLYAVFLVIGVVIGWRLVFDWLSSRVGPSERLLLVGTSPGAVELARELHELRRQLGVEIVGFVDPDPSRVGSAVFNPGVIGTIDAIPSIVRDRQVDRVVVSLSDARGKLPMDQLLEMKLNGVSFDHLASVYEEYTGKIAVENLRPSWLIFSSGFRQSAWLASAKRVLDLVASMIGIVLAAPLMILVAAGVRLTSAGPALYHQERVGLRGRIFTVHKFRSMRVDAELNTGAIWASADDPRITPIGRFLRRARLDELPQLWNVLCGDMSFVGPRPERPYFVDMLSEEIPFYHERHAVKPGITGWAQVKYRYGASVEDAAEKLRYDLYYIKHLSVIFDLTIVFDTVKVILFGKGAQ
jgi:sugar transferase (PEP-CTERM system associated)